MPKCSINLRSIKKGVLQRSILDPILFIIHVNDIPILNLKRCELSLYHTSIAPTYSTKH